VSQYTTEFGSIHAYQSGSITVINDDKKKYVMSNLFEVAAKSSPWERVAVGKNFEYVVESVRAEGTSPWYTAAHDEFAVAMDGRLDVHFVKLDDPDAVVDPESEGAHKLDGEPVGKKMGHVELDQGHMTMLPVGAAYRFEAPSLCTIMIQTIQGPETIERWAETCQQ